MSRPPFGYRPPSLPDHYLLWFLIAIGAILLVLELASCKRTKPHPPAKQATSAETYNVIAGWDASQDQRVAGYKMHLRSPIKPEAIFDAGAASVGVATNLSLGVPYSLALSAYSASGQTSEETNPIVFVLSGDGQLPIPLRNISTRAFVQSGDRVVIAGFIVAAHGRFLVRGLGPSLAAFGITDPLLDPVIALRSKTDAVASNDDWTTNETELRAAVPTLLPTNPKEAALLTTLEPGDYTVILSGANKSSGTGLVEVYYVP